MATRRAEADASGMTRAQQIIAVSTELFHTRGYMATSLDDVAERIGFTKPAIYYYFKSKEDILFAIVSRIVDDALARMKAIAEQDAPVPDRMYRLLVENTRTILDNLEANTVFYNSRGMLSAERERDIREREREYTRVMRDLYAEGVEAGVLLPIDPTIATSTLLGASIWSYRWFDPAGPKPDHQVAEDVATLLLNGFAVR